MANEISVKAQTRKEFGKGPSRRARVAGLIPAVIYANGEAPAHILVPYQSVNMSLKTPNALFEIAVGSKKYLAIAKDVQRHPFKPEIKHIDFIEVKKDQKVEVQIPINLVGESVPNTLVLTNLEKISVMANPTSIPNSIDVEIANLEIGTQVTVSEIKLPSDLELLENPETIVLAIQSISRKEASSDSEETEESGKEE